MSYKNKVINYKQKTFDQKDLFNFKTQQSGANPYELPANYIIRIFQSRNYFAFLKFKLFFKYINKRI